MLAALNAKEIIPRSRFYDVHDALSLFIKRGDKILTPVIGDIADLESFLLRNAATLNTDNSLFRNSAISLQNALDEHLRK